MAKVSDVDPRLIERTRDWLVTQQQADGSWRPDASFINEGATDRYNSNVLRITAYIAWSLADTGIRARPSTRPRTTSTLISISSPDPYTLAVIANFAAEYGRDPGFTRRPCRRCSTRARKRASRSPGAPKRPAFIPPAQALPSRPPASLRRRCSSGGSASETVRKALNFISSKKAGLRCLGHHAGHHHGPSRLTAGHANECDPMCTDRCRSCLTISM